MRVLLAAGLLLAVLAPVAGAASPSTLTYRGDSTRDDRITGAPAPPLGVRWAVDLGAPMSYPVFAGGRVFVSARNTNGYGTTLHGIDAATGHVLWTRANPGTYWYGGMTYDSGRLYVLNFDGNLMALAPATGAILWSRAMGNQYAFDGPPAARDGDLYVIGSGSGGTVYALDGATGATQWTESLPTGGGSPAVDASSVYVSLVCEHIYAFARDGGALRWEHHGDCSGGGDVTPAVHGGRVYPQGDNPAILDAATGARVGTAAFNGAIGFGEGRAYVPWNGGVIGVDDPGWLTRWSFGGPGVSGEAPLVGNSHLYLALEGGAVAALDRATGRPVWCASTGGLDVAGLSDASDGSHPKSELGAGGGMLFVPAGRFLAAYGPGGAPPLPCGAGAGPAGGGPGLTLRARREDVLAGRRATLDGALSGLSATAGVTVDVQADPWPFDGRWHSRVNAVTGADGTFSATVRPRRNTRYRARGAGLESGAATLYAELTARFDRKPLGGRRFRETLRISGPCGTRVRARRESFYIVRAGRRTARLEQRSRLRRVAPARYRARAVLRYLRPRRDTVVFACYRERTPDPWGRPSPLDPVCGRARLRLAVAATSAATATAAATAGHGARDATARFTVAARPRFG